MRIYTVKKLKIGVVTEPPTEFVKSAQYQSCDIIVFKYGAFGEVFISAQAEMLPVKKMAEISRGFDGVLIAPGPTDVYGLKYKSALVFRRGSLIDIADRVKNDGEDEYENSYRLMIYRINGIRCGLIIAEDVKYLDTFTKFVSSSDIFLYVGDEEGDFVSPLAATEKPYLAFAGDEITVKTKKAPKQTGDK